MAPLGRVVDSWNSEVSKPAGTPFGWDAGLGIGVCGDWLQGDRVEDAYLSGVALGAHLREHLGSSS
jgi:predicted NAD/FAD-dependent oxidoreductase